MADERIIYKGAPSPVTILGTLALNLLIFIAMAAGLIYFRGNLPKNNARYVLFALLLIPVLIFLGKWVMLKFVTYEITTQRVKVVRGILSKRTDETELYRAKDTTLFEPFLYRVFNVGNILFVTNDASTPTIEVKGLPNARDIREQLRTAIEECRTRKRTSLLELE